MPCSVGKGSHDPCFLLVSVKGRLPRELDIPLPECTPGYQKLRCVNTDWPTTLQVGVRTEGAHLRFLISSFLSSGNCDLPLERADKGGVPLSRAPLCAEHSVGELQTFP